MRVAVIGAGIVGVCCAAALRDAGHDAVLLDPGEPGGEQAASFGNGAWLSPASVVPMSMPGLWRRVPGLLADPLGPLAIRPTALPGLLPWLLRFLHAGATVARVEATARALRPLLADAPARHATLAETAGVGALIKRRGLLYAYPSQADFTAEALAWRLRRDNGVTWEELDAASLHAKAPALSDRYRFGVFLATGGHCTDPGGYVAALARHAAVRRVRAVGFDIAGGRLRAVRTNGAAVPCDRAVIAAGIGSAALARACGDRVSLASERGYHAVLRDPEVAPDIPVMPSDGKMANTLTLAGLRTAGQVELAGPNSPPDWRRADVLLAHLLRSYDGLLAAPAPERVSRWMGHRPSTPDGLPVIGPASACADVIYAFGHGHVGLAAAPATARLVAALLDGTPSACNLAPYSPRRFRISWSRSPRRTP